MRPDAISAAHSLLASGQRVRTVLAWFKRWRPSTTAAAGFLIILNFAFSSRPDLSMLSDPRSR